MMETFQGGRVGTFCITQVTKMFYSSILSTVLAKGEMEPERKETRTKVDEDRKHEYPYRPRPILMLLLGKDIFSEYFARRHQGFSLHFFFHNQGHVTLTIVASIS